MLNLWSHIITFVFLTLLLTVQFTLVVLPFLFSLVKFSRLLVQPVNLETMPLVTMLVVVLVPVLIFCLMILFLSMVSFMS